MITLDDDDDTTDTPDEEYDRLVALAIAATALQRWTRVETHLSILFSHISGIKQAESAHIILASIISFETRLSVCNAAMNLIKTNKRQRTIWSWLYNRMTKAYKKRHELAHFSVRRMANGKGIKLIPFFSPGRFIAGKGDGLNVDQIQERSINFYELGDDLRWFHFEIERHLRKRGARKLSTPDRVRQHLAEVAQTRAEKQPQPRSKRGKIRKKR